jgi:hypothetical protein
MRVPKTYLNKFKIIEEPCTAVVQCMATVDDSFLSKNKKSYFIPLRAISIDEYDNLIDVLSEEEEEDIDITKLYPFMLTGTLWKDKVLSKLDLPVKGENLIATFEEEDLDGLKCTGIVTLGKAKLKKFNLTKAISNV